MQKTYRDGAIGALADEYEKALDDLIIILSAISEDQFMYISDPGLEEDFQSIKNIVLHIVCSGYVYANHIRKRFGNTFINPGLEINSIRQALQLLDKMFKYTLETFEDKWLLTDDDLLSTIIKTSWTTYDLEALIEHAIVHILRHRLQIEKRILRFERND